ncbi:class II fumarate hydratase [bacterium]|jgi:fumarate hydratase class II|nr:class II fumarate hydratase [bacterium]MBT3795298.1 class II fumarate hydratase [bacterium]MBT4633952.1 class II fumarate hydratase [bacterium]
MIKKKFRKESDSMGQMSVPKDALYGAQTARAVENFPISKLRFNRSFIEALGVIKFSAAKTNLSLKLISADVGNSIMKAANEVICGKHDTEFVVDIFQTGSGTSSNMNANEVIATLANKFIKGKTKVHPNDHVNLCQSSNDVIPTAMYISVYSLILNSLIPNLKTLEKELASKARKFDKIFKIGRTHLQDATPITLGQEFGGYSSMISRSIGFIKEASVNLSELAQGGTAVGTGINSHPKFGKKVALEISKKVGIKFKEASNHFEAQASKDALVLTSGALKTLATSLMKIANDIRWLGSGPRCGFGEISVPAIQPGSSIMPGKVNPVLAESVTQVCAQVIGNDSTISIAGQSGNFELNVMMPVMAHNMIESVEILSNASLAFAKDCISGIEANKEQCEGTIEKSLAMCTSLAPVIGYDKAAAVAKKAFNENKTVREVVDENKILKKKEASRILDPKTMIKPSL